ncbi:acetoacetyl-CoA synthase [Lineolata rhizophorae]|uniref:Acetoacetyl-CoA synthase n=1 Tax=Lineolata rhizophorae TaxID=578093 RepID=A0A6A6NV46_9PEZI|nr:acetoacetyl-CoA synthase [Lineolata rhizophorae]
MTLPLKSALEERPPVPRKLWEHPDPTSTQTWEFMQGVNKKRGKDMKTYWDLYQWSVDELLEFYEDLWEFEGLIHEGSYEKIVDPTARIDSIPHWFDGIRLNFAENILYDVPSRSSMPTTRTKPASAVAVVAVREGYTETTRHTWGALRARVGLMANALRARGTRTGDRVAAVASNGFDTLCVFLGAVALGAVFSSSSTDMGAGAVLERLRQVRPRFVFVDDGALYNGKRVDLRGKMGEIARGLEGVGEFEGMVGMPRFAGETADVGLVPRCETLEEFLEAAKGDERIRFERVGFGEPFLVAYSSGTTGQPKCIVHSTGGVLVNAAKEGMLHFDMRPQDVYMQYTTTGWIMYMAQVIKLLHGTRVIMYDGSPFKPNMTTFLLLTADEKVTNLGMSPRWMHELQKRGIRPREVADLSSLHTVSSTGMVLSESLFHWFYDEGFPRHAILANISGGTDLAGTFAIHNPLLPMHAGGCVAPGLGLRVKAFDQTIEGGKGVKGREVKDGMPGELVCTNIFPNVPVYFWGDTDGQRFFDAYFARFDNVWTHGDLIMFHSVTRQIIFLGRADGVLNPSGVRFGSAEIYTVIESFFPEVADSICVGRRRPQDADEAVMLFLLMQAGQKFSDRLVRDVKTKIAKELSKRHVPKFVFETKAIPTTVNLKKVELPVKRIVSGEVIKPSGTIVNPESLDYYYQFAKVEEDGVAPQSKL